MGEGKRRAPRGGGGSKKRAAKPSGEGKRGGPGGGKKKKSRRVPIEKTRARQAAGKKSSTKPGRAKKAVTARGAPPRREEFRNELGSLETLLDEALLEAGGPVDGADAEGAVVRAAEGALDVYANLARTLEESSVSEAFASLSDRMRGDPSDFGYDADFENAILPLLRFLYRRWWRVDLVGVDLVPDEGPVVLVGNHSGSLLAYDGAMLRRAVADHHPRCRAVRPMLDPSLCNLPLLGDVMARCGGVPASEDSAQAVLERGEIVASFPEGREGFLKSFRRRYELGSFDDDDFVRVALRAGAAIVPVAIVGAEETHPALGRLDWLAHRVGLPSLPVTPTFPLLGLGGLLPLPSRWRIEFGAPLRGLGDLGREAAEDRRRVKRIATRARSRVQSLVDGAVERRGRAFL